MPILQEVHKLRSERKAQIAKDWLSSNECGAFMAKLSGEMINNGILLEAEAHRLAAAELRVDTEKLASLVKSKKNEALANLSEIFTRESETLNDAAWEAEEQKQ